MSQLNFQAIGGFEIERDYDAVKAIVGDHAFDEFRALPVGEFYFAALNRFARWRPRHTTHGGDAPAFAEAGTGPRLADDKLGPLIDELRDAFARDAALAEPPDPSHALRVEIRRLERELTQAEAARRAAEAETDRLRVALHVAGVIKVVIQNEIVVAASRPAAVSPAPAPAPTPAPAAAPAPPPPPPPAVVTATVARPATPTLRDLGLSPERLLELPGVHALLLDARKRARRRSPRSVNLVTLGARLLAAGHTLTPEELAGRYGSRSQVTIRRAEHALDGLSGAGYATIRDGRHYAREDVILRAAQVR
jgi:hypothetical protein